MKNLLFILVCAMSLSSCEEQVRYGNFEGQFDGQFEGNVVAPVAPVARRRLKSLVRNGSFERREVVGNNNWDVLESLPGWRVDRNQSDAGIELQEGLGIAGLSPSHGLFKVQLDAHAKNGFTETDVVMYQKICKLEVGARYEVQFKIASYNGNGATSQVEVFFGGRKVKTFDSDVRGWQTVRFRRKARAKCQKLSFVSSPDNDTHGAYLDDVRMYKL